MLHAIKPMTWQALQTLKEPNEDAVKRTKLQVLSHNLSAEGTLSELVKSFETYFPLETEKVECRRYLDTAIQDALTALRQTKTEKEQKICVERVHEVCWQLCWQQIKASLPALLTEESAKIWWKIFNAFAERDSENERTLYPVVMDWEEVDYWANVVLKVMALPTNTQSRREREVLGSTALTFQEALVRFNAKLNENNGMQVLDQGGKPDIKYIESSMQELNVRLFEGIHLVGSLVSVKKSHAHIKWCVLYQRGLAFADSAAELDCSNPKAFVPIGEATEVAPVLDKQQRPRFQLVSGPGVAPLLFEANNISVRNEWITAIICLKHGKLPDYEKDFINRRKARTKTREFEAEAKETMRKQKERTKKQVEEMSRSLEAERVRHAEEFEQLRTATEDQLRARIAQHDVRMAELVTQMTDLGEQYEREKVTMAEQHEAELQRRAGEHGDRIRLEQGRLQQQLEADRADNRNEIAKRDAKIQQLEAEVTRLKLQLRDEADRLATKVHQLEVHLEKLETDNEKLEEKIKQQENQEKRRASTSRRLMIMNSEDLDEEKILIDIIYQETGLDPGTKVLNESVNDFSIATCADQKD